MILAGSASVMRQPEIMLSFNKILTFVWYTILLKMMICHLTDLINQQRKGTVDMSEEKTLAMSKEDFVRSIINIVNKETKGLSDGITKAFTAIGDIEKEVETLRVELEGLKKQNAKQDTSLSSIYSNKSP